MEHTLSAMRKAGNLESRMPPVCMNSDLDYNGDDYQMSRIKAPIINFCYEVDQIMRQCEIAVRRNFFIALARSNCVGSR